MTLDEAETLIKKMRDFIECIADDDECAYDGDAGEIWKEIEAADWCGDDFDWDIGVDDVDSAALEDYVAEKLEDTAIPDTTRVALVRSGARLYNETSAMTYGGLCHFVEDELA